ncbi:hypothetical protein LG202_21810 [Methylobacillus methanolivorans]
MCPHCLSAYTDRQFILPPTAYPLVIAYDGYQTNRIAIFYLNNLSKEQTMNWDQVEGNWKQLKGKVRQQWGKLTDDQFEQIKGNREMLSGKLQELYGISKEEAEKQIESFNKTCTKH